MAEAERLRRGHRATQRRHQQVGVDTDQALRLLTRHRVGDAGADVATLGDIAIVAEAVHQLGPCTRRTAQIPAEIHRLAREPVPGKGRQHEMESVLVPSTVRGRVGQRADGVE